MMISGFEWERYIARAAMGAGITKQILKYCVDTLIPKLEERRFWAEAFNVLNAQHDPLLQQSLDDVHFFERLARKWKFVRDAKRRVWRLYFVAMIQPPPEVDADAIEPEGESGPSDEGAAFRTMRTDDGPADGVAARTEVEPQPREPQNCHRIGAFFTRRRLGRLRAMARVAAWAGQDAMERLVDDFNYFAARLQLRRVKVAQSLTALVNEMRLMAACAPRQLMQLEFVRIGFGADQTLELSRYRSQEPDWNSWLFGRLLDEDFVLR